MLTSDFCLVALLFIGMITLVKFVILMIFVVIKLVIIYVYVLCTSCASRSLHINGT